MRKILLVIIVFVFTACGGGVPVENTRYSYSENTDLSRFLDEGQIHVTSERYPHLYIALVKSDFSAISSMVGTYNFSLITIGSGDNKVYALSSKGPDGTMRTRELLLHYSMKQGDLDEVRTLLKEGADPNYPVSNGLTPLQVVFDKKSKMPDKLQLMDILLNAGADPNRKSEKGKPTVHFVAGADISDINDKKAAITKLMEHGMDPNQTDEKGNTALYAAYAKAQDQELAEMLLGAGVDIGKGESLIALVLISKIEDKEAAIKTLLAHGADPNQTDRYGTPLLTLIITSAMENKLSLVNSLLDHGANPNLTDEKGIPLLNRVMMSDIVDKSVLISSLVEYGADPNLKDSSGNTALHKALNPKLRYIRGISENTIISWIEPMIAKGADLNIRNDQGKTVLTYASSNLADYLREKGATDIGEQYQRSASIPSTTDRKENILGMDTSDLLMLKQEDCHSILRDHEVAFLALSDIENVDFPIRLESPIDGVSFRHTHESDKYSIMDCRLAVALIGWAPVLKEFGVVEVKHMRTYSPGARVGGGSKVSGHNFAMAIDASQFILNDGTTLEVVEDWTDRRHRVDPCTPPESGDHKDQGILREIACETGSVDLFSMILTPHYNRAHYDHLHLEITDEVYDYLR